MMDPTRSERNLEHALWRVNFLASLLQTHRALGRRDEGWWRKEADYLERLAWAEQELTRCHAQRPLPQSAGSPPGTPDLPLNSPPPASFSRWGPAGMVLGPQKDSCRGTCFS